MMKRTRRDHSGSFKAKVTVVALRGDRTLTEQYQVHARVTEWKRQLLERAPDVFDGTGNKSKNESDLKVRHAKIRQQALEIDFLRSALTKAGLLSTYMINRSYALPVTRQSQILSLARSTAYYRPQEACAADLTLMCRFDELHLDYPFSGSRMLRYMLGQNGQAIDRKHVGTLMKTSKRCTRSPTPAAPSCSCSLFVPAPYRNQPA